MAGKTGIDAAFIITHRLCRLLATWRSKINTFIDSQVVAGHITLGQGDTVKLWLDGAEAACAILEVLAPYNNIR